MASNIFVSLLARQSNQIGTRRLGANLAAATKRSIFTSQLKLQEPQKQPTALHQYEQDEAQSNSSDHIDQTPCTNRLHFIEPANVPRVAAYRVLNPDGSLNGEIDPTLTEEKIVKLYEQMLLMNAFDRIMYDCQRQGRISFYMTNFGEEAVAFGSAAALNEQDWIFAQYRETGILLQRGMPVKLMAAQLFGNKEDIGKGRAMPVHYGNRSLNFVPISSPLTVQLPQAAGSAYALKLRGRGQIVATYFGEGAASEGDFHAAMNFAAALDCSMVFVCRNNGYAISTPANEQYVGDGIVHRGLGYGMRAIRVDGNDLFAVYAATRAARKLCQQQSGSKPCLIEAMTYRVGHHSTSDDSTAYRSADEVRRWEQTMNPIKRVQKYLSVRGLWSDELEKACQRDVRAQVIEALSWAEQVKKPPVETMFDDVYDELPANLRRQRDELREHLGKYGQHYSLDQHEQQQQ